MSIRVTDNFPGGNIKVINMNGSHLQLAQDMRDSSDHWFYWHCRIDNANGQLLHIELMDENLLTREGAIISFDNQATYNWHEYQEGENENNFYIKVPDDCDSFFLGMCHPYTLCNLEETLAPFAGNPLLSQSVFCQSNGERDVPVIYLGKEQALSQPDLLITARHHACETTPSFMIDGMIQAFLTSEEPAFQWLRENAKIQIIPFMDMDGVEKGDQGKGRQPHDHNRDYSNLEKPLYQEVATLKGQVRSWQKEGHTLAIDLHCPWIKHQWNEHSYFVGLKDQSQWDKIQALSNEIENSMTGKLPFSKEGNLPYGMSWNTDTNYGSSVPNSCSKWLDIQPAIDLGATLETPYADVGDAYITVVNAKNWGSDVLRGASLYLHNRT